METQEKVIKDGKVAIVHSADYGMCLFSNYPNQKELLFSPVLVELVEMNRTDEITPEFLRREFGIENGSDLVPSYLTLKVTYLPIGMKFTIVETDGKEVIITQDNLKFEA